MTTYNTLIKEHNKNKDDIVGINSQLSEIPNQSYITEKATKSYVDTITQSLGSGSPKGTFATFTDLQTAFPSGNINTYVVTADGKWYYWNGSAWTPGGTYQSAGIADKSVKAKHTDFIDISSNLYDDSTKSLGYNISSSTGALVANASYNSSDFIEIKPSTNYSYLGFLNVAYYDINKQFISRPQLIYTGITLTSPSNAYFIRTHFEVNTLTTYLRQINESATLLQYENYYKKLDSKYINLDFSVLPKETSFFDISTNLFDNQNATLGYAILSGTGEPSENTSYSISEYVPVKYSTAYSFIGINRVVWYDANKNYISNITRVDYNPRTEISPATAVFARFSIQNIELDIAQFNEGDILLPYENGTPKLKTWVYGEIPKSDDLYNVDIPIDGVFDTNETYVGFTDMYTRTASQIYSLFDALMASYPDYITKEFLGNEATGLPIYVYYLTPTIPITDKPSKMIKIFLTCGTHGIEKASTLSTYLMIKQMCEKWGDYPLLEALRFNVKFIVMPVVNPWGWNNGDRRNSRGVDINRNFPYQWVQGTSGTQTYGGSAPLSELEAQYVKSIFDNNKDIDIMYDFHNFFTVGVEPNEQFLWIPTNAGLKVQHIAQNLISRLTRKWGKEFNFLDGKFVGYTSTVADGMIQNYAHSLGIKYCGTFEVRDGWKLDATGQTYDENMCKAGVEAITNWLLLNIKDLIASQ